MKKLLLACFFAAAALHADVMEDVFAKGIDADLRDPTFCEGVLKTERGGVITGPDFRIQAQTIIYTRKLDKENPIFTICAEGDLMMEFGNYVFVGERLEYDFQERSGVIYNGRTMVAPWYFGGEAIHLCPDGSYVIHSAFVTTSENFDTDWQVFAKSVALTQEKKIFAKSIQFRVLNIPLLWIPSVTANIDSFLEGPFRYYARGGGRLGPRVGIIYELFSWNRWKTYLRFDYRIKRGPGGGTETHYKSADHKTTLDMINYFARDSSLEKPHEKYRYRFQGIYNTLLMDDKISVNLTYDKLSDQEMASDYKDQGIELDTGKRTQLLVRRQEENWITNFVSSVRINAFQTIKQELPTLETSWRPFELGSTGIISENRLKASFLNFAYGNNLKYDKDYNSSRFEFSPRLYRPFRIGCFNATPEIGLLGIYYGHSKDEKENWEVINANRGECQRQRGDEYTELHGKANWLALGLFNFDLNTNFYRYYPSWKHVLTPYLNYQYISFPSINPDYHYVFDIEDGWYRLNMLQLGLAQNLFFKNNCCIGRYLYADLHTNAFFGTRSIPAVVPKVYSRVIFNTLPTLKHTFAVSWDFEKKQVDHFNLHTEWTLNNDTALAIEYRHRSAFDWRKVDYNNFILDSFRSINEMRHSSLSDRRDTLLVHLFYRFHPNWALELVSRQGWNRDDEPKYTEFEFDLLAKLRSAWNVKLSYQHRENDDRVAVYFSLGKKRPIQKDCSNVIPCLEF